METISNSLKEDVLNSASLRDYAHTLEGVTQKNASELAAERKVLISKILENPSTQDYLYNLTGIRSGTAEAKEIQHQLEPYQAQIISEQLLIDHARKFNSQEGKNVQTQIDLLNKDLLDKRKWIESGYEQSITELDQHGLLQSYGNFHEYLGELLKPENSRILTHWDPKDISTWNIEPNSSFAQFKKSKRKFSILGESFFHLTEKTEDLLYHIRDLQDILQQLASKYALLDTMSSNIDKKLDEKTNAIAKRYPLFMQMNINPTYGSADIELSHEQQAIISSRLDMMLSHEGIVNSFHHSHLVEPILGEYIQYLCNKNTDSKVIITHNSLIDDQGGVDAYIDYIDGDTLDRLYIDYKINGLPTESHMIESSKNEQQIDSLITLNEGVQNFDVILTNPEMKKLHQYDHKLELHINALFTYALVDAYLGTLATNIDAFQELIEKLENEEKSSELYQQYVQTTCKEIFESRLFNDLLNAYISRGHVKHEIFAALKGQTLNIRPLHETTITNLLMDTDIDKNGLSIAV